MLVIDHYGSYNNNNNNIENSNQPPLLYISVRICLSLCLSVNVDLCCNKLADTDNCLHDTDTCLTLTGYLTMTDIWQWQLYDTDSVSDNDSYMTMIAIWQEYDTDSVYDNDSYMTMTAIWQWQLYLPMKAIWHWHLYDTDNYPTMTAIRETWASSGQLSLYIII